MSTCFKPSFSCFVTSLFMDLKLIFVEDFFINILKSLSSPSLSFPLSLSPYSSSLSRFYQGYYLPLLLSILLYFSHTHDIYCLLCLFVIFSPSSLSLFISLSLALPFYIFLLLSLPFSLSSSL